jgi:hypothetical protein
MLGQRRIELYYTFSHLTVRTSCSPCIKAFSDDLKFNILSLPQCKAFSKIYNSLERIWMTIEATTFSRLIWNAWTHTGIVCMIREGECREYALDTGHVLVDPALQSSLEGAVPTFEGARGRGVNTSQFGLLNGDEVLIWEVGQCPFCCHPLDH